VITTNRDRSADLGKLQGHCPFPLADDGRTFLPKYGDLLAGRRFTPSRVRGVRPDENVVDAVRSNLQYSTVTEVDMRIIRTVAAPMLVLLLTTTAVAAVSKSEAKKLNEAAAVVSELRSSPDSGIPDSIWSKAECVVVIPSLKKAGFIVAGESGSGVMSCRRNNRWGPPVFMQMTKGSAGFQAGVSSTDLVLVILNQRGAEKLLGNKVTLGADASVAAGPVGRTASAGTDAQMTAEMLSYSRAKGMFAGVDLSGGSLRPDQSANDDAYGPNASAREIALGTRSVPTPPEARMLMDAFNRQAAATSGTK